MTPQQERFTEYLLSRMEACNLKQADVAEVTGVTGSYISKLVTGSYHYPPGEGFVRKLAKCFGDSPADAIEAAGIYDKKKLDDAIRQDPNIATAVRKLYGGSFI